MKIETLDDWNAVNGCCCFMPYCPMPQRECRTIYGIGQVAFVLHELATDTYYGTSRTDYEDGGFSQSRAISSHWTQLGGVWIEPRETERTEGDPQTGESQTTLSDPVDLAASRDASFAAMVGALDWETMTGYPNCDAYRADLEPVGYPAYHLGAGFMRFRWVVPDDFEGKYFKITWDVVEEPDGWDSGEPNAPVRSFFAQDQTWEWTGPGDPDDPDSWKSGWYHIDPPASAGARRVVNIRYECYRSAKFGTKPQVTGEAVELPDP